MAFLSIWHFYYFLSGIIIIIIIIFIDTIAFEMIKWASDELLVFIWFEKTFGKTCFSRKINNRNYAIIILNTTYTMI